MSLIVTIQTGDATTDVRAQRIQQDPLVEGNFIIEGVTGLNLSVMSGDILLVHTMSVPKPRVVAYYGGALVEAEKIVDAAGELLKELSLKKSREADEELPREWRGIEGTTYSA
jgi:hypothetical protein